MAKLAEGRPYETLFIVRPDQGGAVKDLIQRFQKIVEESGGAVTHVEEWGVRDLAYRLQKQSRGYYILFQYRSSFRAVEELERNMKLTDPVMRYLTVRLEEMGTTPLRQSELSKQPGKSAEEHLGKPAPQS